MFTFSLAVPSIFSFSKNEEGGVIRVRGDIHVEITSVIQINVKLIALLVTHVGIVSLRRNTDVEE